MDLSIIQLLFWFVFCFLFFVFYFKLSDSLMIGSNSFHFNHWLFNDRIRLHFLSIWIFNYIIRLRPLSVLLLKVESDSASSACDSLIHSFQSRDRLKDLEGKTSIELQHKRLSFSSVSQPQIFRSPLERIKQRYFWTKCEFWPFAIHIKHPWQYFNQKQCDKTL